MRILVSWDDEAQLELLKMYLGVDGNVVSATTDYDEFSRHLSSDEPYDVVLYAINSPDFETAFDRFTEFTALRPEYPVVGACPAGDAYRVARFLTAGMRNYFLRDANGDFMFLIHVILQTVVRQVETERERLVSEQLRREVESVRELQESIIPHNVDTPDGFGIAGRYESSQIRVIGSKPVTMAGGDYYEAFTLPDNRMVLLVGDASGHGMKACMSIFTMHTLIRMIRFDDFMNAGTLVQHINEQLCRQSVVNSEGGFITMQYGVFDPESRELSWASAGHHPPILHNMETGEVAELANAEETSGLPIGIFEDGGYTTNRHIIPPNSRLLMYTDGLTEAFPGENRGSHVEFGVDGLITSLRNSTDKPLDECLQALFDDSYAFTEGSGRHDDTSVLILESK